jgi:hypothetical protein
VRILRGSPGVGGIRVKQSVDKQTQWKKLIDLPEKTATRKLDQSWAAGMLNGKLIEISVDKPKK